MSEADRACDGAGETAAESDDEDEDEPSSRRRFHLRIGPDEYLVVDMHVADAAVASDAAGDAGGKGWFGDLQFNEVLSLLRERLPNALSEVLRQKSMAPKDFDFAGDSLCTHLRFIIAGSTNLWSVDQAAQLSLRSCDYMLLLDVTPLSPESRGRLDSHGFTRAASSTV